MAYLTPDETPDEKYCRRFFIPASFQWDAILYGALSELAKSYNWEQFGSTTVAEAVSVAEAMLADYDAMTCGDELNCEIADGESILRIGIGGRVEQWREGEWTTPDGVYTQPPLTPRSEPLDEDKRCNAAANAVNVYGELYEITTDAATDFEFLDEFLDVVFDGIGEWVGLWAGETAKSFAQLGRQFASQFFLFWEEITEDYWDAEFEDYFRCVLYEFSTVTGSGAVEFDYDAIRQRLLNDSVTSLDLNRVILVTQLEYLFYFTGAADGFNAAGGTTAITGAECDNCDETWCLDFDFTVSNGGWVANTQGQWVSGAGWQTTGLLSGAYYRALDPYIDLGADYVITYFRAEFSVTWGGIQGTPADARNITLRLNSPVPNDPARIFAPSQNQVLLYQGELHDVDRLYFLCTTAYDNTNPRTDLGGQCTLRRVVIRGQGSNPLPDYACL